MSEAWKTEIIELHEFFEGYFLGTLPLEALDRAEAAFHPHFSMIGPDGDLRNRATILQMLHDGHHHTDDLTITTAQHTLVHQLHGLGPERVREVSLALAKARGMVWK